MALPVWQAEASSADDRWWLQRLSPGKDGGRERRDGVIFTADPKPVTEIMVEGKAELLAGLHQAEHEYRHLHKTNACLSTAEMGTGAENGSLVDPFDPPGIPFFITSVEKAGDNPS